MAGAATIAQQSALAAESIGDRRRDDFDPSRSAQVLMHDQPDRANRGRLIGPDANDIRRGIAEEACQLGNADLARRRLELDERIIATRCYARSLKRLAHEKRARGGRRAGERYQIITGQPLASLWDAVFGKIVARPLE